MRYLVLCCDYDGTIAHHGRVGESTIAALERLRATGRRLVLVTGRQIEDLKRVFSRVDLFDRIVAENGALIYRPATREERVLAEPPPREFLEQLEARGVTPLSVGRVIVATWEPHEHSVLETIRRCGLELQLIFNKGAVMVLPAGVNKASGLNAALTELNISPHNAVGVGDAENDHAFLSLCECSVAVANALPAIKEAVDLVLPEGHGRGVERLIDEMITDDLASRSGTFRCRDVTLGKTMSGADVGFSPYEVSALIAGVSGGGKSTVAAGLIERLRAAGYTFCVIDPEGDYDALESAVVVGSPAYTPMLDECVQLLDTPGQNLVVNLLGLKLEERPWFFLALFARLRELRARTGRPHWLLVDEAHHVLPATWRPVDETLPERLQGVVLVSVSPGLIARSVLRAIDTLLVVGDGVAEMLDEFTGIDGPALDIPGDVQPGEALLWSRRSGGSPLRIQLEPSRTQRRRHLRKYAVGELPRDRSFYFTGPQGKLNLRAHNLLTFLDMADGVDDETWLYHLKRGEVSGWLRNALKDEALAGCVAAVERSADADPTVTRRRIRELVEAVYTAPAGSGSGCGL